MRLTVAAFAMTMLAAPTLAGDIGAENLFGHDPGNNPAYACFSRTFDEAWLKARPEQNVAKLTVFVSRRTSDGTVWHDGNLEIRFRDSAATYHVTAGCGGENGVLGCGVDCEGGGYQMTAITKSELGIKIDGYLRYYDISDTPAGAKTAGFTTGDKNLVVQRTGIKDCLPLVADEDIKARIAEGAITQ